MKIIFSILINAVILYIMTFLLGTSGITVTWSWKAYLLGWIILWLINVTIKPILKILSIPFFLVTFWLIIFVINWLILKLFDLIINNILVINWVSYSINWWINFIIAVTIFTILNMLFSLFWFKKK